MSRRAQDVLLGRAVFWKEGSNRNLARYQGVVVYDGPPCDMVPVFDEEHWLSVEDHAHLDGGTGRIRFSDVAYGVIVRVDRSHPESGQSLVPWYYAPQREKLTHSIT